MNPAEPEHPKRLLFDCVILYLLTCIGLIAYSAVTGQDANWDGQNYHFYSGWAAHTRFTTDIFAVGYQTYLNQLAYTPAYWAITHYHPLIASSVIAMIQCLNAPLLFIIASEVLIVYPRRMSRFLSFFIAMAGLFSPMFLSEVGTTFADSILAIPILLSVAIAAIALRRLPNRTWLILIPIGIAGLITGLACGTKLTNCAFAVGFAVAIGLSPWNLKHGILRLLVFGCSVIAGFVADAAPLFRVLWTTFQNPLFPFYNHIFKSPFIQPDDLSDQRWHAKGISDGLTYPFQWAIGLHPSNELPFRDVRFACIALLVPVALVLFVMFEYGRGYVSTRYWDDAIKQRVFEPIHARFLLLFLVISFAPWLFVFGIQRYIVPLELLAPLALFMLIDYIFAYKNLKVLLMLLLGVLGIVTVKVPDWGHIAWASEWYGVHFPPAIAPENGLYLLLTEPVGFALPSLPRSSQFVALRASTKSVPALAEKIKATVGSHKGPIWILARKESFDSENQRYTELLSEYGLAPAPEACTEVPSRMMTLTACRIRPLQLQGDKDDFLHLSMFEIGGKRRYQTPAPVAFGTRFSVEMIITARGQNPPHADIITNHPGSKDFRGFVIEQAGDNLNRFIVGFGNGTPQWGKCGEVLLPAGRRSHMVTVMSEKECSIYLNGDLVASGAASPPLLDSDYTLNIGDWGARDRTFSGVIEEVRLTRKELSRQEIRQTASRMGLIQTAWKSEKAFILPNRDNEILHKGFWGPVKSAMVPAIKLPQAFTLELLLTGGKEDGHKKTLVSNQLGTNGLQGVSIQTSATNPEMYEISFGSGKNWVTAGDFSIPRQGLAYVVFVIEAHQCRTYVNGVAQPQKFLGIDPVDSESSVVLGNSYDGDTPFGGTIHEIRISPGSADPAYIESTLKKVEALRSQRTRGKSK